MGSTQGCSRDASITIHKPEVLYVTSTLDGHDSLPGDGVCEVNKDRDDCSLRAAIEEANALSGQTDSMRIEISPGVYNLSLRAAENTESTASLIIDMKSTKLRIYAASATVSVLAPQAEALFDIASGQVSLEGLTIASSNGVGINTRAGSTAHILRSSVVDHNSAGISIGPDSKVTIEGSTIAGNQLGIKNKGTLLSSFSTITENTEFGLFNKGSTEFRATVIVNQLEGSDCSGAVSSFNFNMDSDGTCGLKKPGDSTRKDTNLVKTVKEQGVYYMPSSLSSVVDSIDAGSKACSKSAAKDQREIERPIGNACDSGAIETGYVTVEQRHYKTAGDSPFSETWSECSKQWPDEYGPLGINADGHLRIAEPFKPPVNVEQGKHLPAVGCAWRQYSSTLTKDVQVEVLWTGIRPFEGTPLLHISPGTQRLGIGAWPAHAMPGLTRNVVLLAGWIGNPPETFGVLPGGIIGFKHIEGTPRRIAIRSSGERFQVWGSHLNTGNMVPFGNTFDIPEELIGSSRHGMALDTHFATPQWPTAEETRAPVIPPEISADGPVILEYRISEFRQE